jgi:nicotinamide mononucleotide transporter
MNLLMSTMFSLWGYDLSYLEFLATTSSFYGVWLGTTGRRSTWPWWAISSALYAILFYKWDLLASASLQFVFIAAAVLGWFGWGPQGATPRVASWTNRGIVAVLGFALTAVLAPWLASLGAAATWPDSFGLIFSIVAQYIMVREYRENWVLWFIVDGVYTIEYFTQDLKFTALLYLFFTLIAVRGWIRWATGNEPGHEHLLETQLTR